MIILQPMVRLTFFLLGVVWIEQKGSRAPLEVADILVVAPHSTFYDGLTCTAINTSVVAKTEIMSAPFLGSKSFFTQSTVMTAASSSSMELRL